MGKSSSNSHAKKSDKETQSPMLKIFKDIMQRENSDLEKTTLVKDKRKTKKKKQYSSIKSTPKSDQRSECSEPARQDTQSTIKEKSKKLSEKYTHSSGPTSQNFEKKDSWWVWREQQKDFPDIKNASTNCSCASCQLKKIISHEYACIGCLLCFFALSVLIALMLLFKSMHVMEGSGVPKAGVTTVPSTTVTRPGAAKKHTDKAGHKKMDLSRAIRRSIGDQLMLGKDSGTIGLSEPDFCLDNNFQDIDRLVQASESRNDLSSILDPNKFSDAQVSPRLRDFYKKLIETDAQIKNLKKGMYDSATINFNFSGKKNFYRLKRSASRHKRNKTQHGDLKEKRDVKEDPIKYEGATTVLMPDPNKDKNSEEKIAEAQEKGNKRKKRLDTETESSIIVEKKQLVVQYLDPSKATLPTFPKCSHIGKDNNKLTVQLMENEKAKKIDDMFEHFIDNNWYSLNLKMHDAILDELRKSLEPESVPENLKQKDFFTVNDNQHTNEPYNKLIEFTTTPKDSHSREQGVVSTFEDRLNKYQDRLRKFEKRLRGKQDKTPTEKHADKKLKSKVIFESNKNKNDKKAKINKKDKMKTKKKHGEVKKPKSYKFSDIKELDDEYCDEKTQVNNEIGGISPIENTSDDDNNVQYKKHLKHRHQQKHRHESKPDNVNKISKKKHGKNLFNHSAQDSFEDEDNSQNKRGKSKNGRNDEDISDDDNDAQRDKRGKKKNDYNSQDDSEYDDGQAVMKKMSDDSGHDYSIDAFKVGPPGGDDLVQPKFNYHASCNSHNCRNKPTVQKTHANHRGQNEDSDDNNPRRGPFDKPLPHKDSYEDKEPCDESPRAHKEPEEKPLSHREPYEDEPKDEPCDYQPKKEPYEVQRHKEPCEAQPKEPKEPCEEKPQKEPCDEKPQKEPCDEKPPKAPCDDDEPQKQPYEDTKESCVEKPKTEPCDDTPKQEPCDDKPKKEPCDDKPNKYISDERSQESEDENDSGITQSEPEKIPNWVSPTDSKHRSVTKKPEPKTTESREDADTTLSSIMKDVTKKLKEMTRYIKQKHQMMEEKCKKKQKEMIKFKNSDNYSEHRIIKRDMDTAYHYQKRTTAPYNMVVSLYTIKTDTLPPPNYMSRLPSRRLMQTNDYEVEDVGYEDLKEVLSDDKDSHDETDRQSDRRRRKTPENFDDVENSMNGGMPLKDTTIITPIKMMNRYHPLGINNQNSKDLMPLYPDELSAYVKNWEDETTIPVRKVEYDKVERSGSYSDASDDEYPEGFHHYDTEGKRVSFAQAYSDYGVINAKKLQTENTKKDDKRVKLSDKKEKNLAPSEGILVQYKPDGDRDDDPKELIQMLQKHLRFSKPKPKILNKYISHTTLVPMSPEFDIVYNPISHLMIKEKKKQRYPEYGYGLGKSLRSLKSMNYDYLDDDSVNNDESIDIFPIYRGFEDLSTQGYITSEELLYDPSENDKKTSKETFPDIFLVTTETVKNVYRNKKYIRSRDVHWGNITVNVTHCVGNKVVEAKPAKATYKYLAHGVAKPDDKDSGSKFHGLRKGKNKTQSITIEETSKAPMVNGKLKKVDRGKSISEKELKTEIDVDKALKPVIDKTVKSKKEKLPKSNKSSKSNIQGEITFKPDPEVEKMLNHDNNIANNNPQKYDAKNSKSLKIKISKENEMKAELENDNSRKTGMKTEDVLHDKALKAELKNDKALAAETQKEKALTEKLANVSDAASKLANDFKSAVEALKKATAAMGKNSADQLVDAKSFLEMLGKWFKDLEKVTPADKKMGTTEAFSTTYNQTTRVLYPIDHPISYTRTLSRHGLQKNRSVNVSDLMFYPMYDGDADVGYKSRLLMSYYDDEHTTSSMDLNSRHSGSSSEASTEPMDKLLQNVNMSGVDNIPTEPVIISPPEPQSADNKTVVKRSAVGSNLVFWNDIYDDEYGIKTDPVENHLKEKGVNNDLMKKSSLWIQDKMKRMTDSIKRKSRDSFNKIYGKRDSRSSNQHGHNLCNKPIMKSSEDFHSLNKRDSLKTLAMHMNVSDLSAHIRGVCKKAAQEVHRTKSSNDSENTVENAVSTTLMQKLVQLMSELVDYQVQQKTCIKLPEDLKDFLEWLTVMGPTTSPNMGTDNSQSKENPIHLEGGIDLATTPSSEREEHDARSECLGTLHAVENLMNEYSHLSDEDKNKMIGVKEYLEDQLEFLTKQLSSIDELSLANIYGRNFMPFRYRRDHSHNMRKRNAHSTKRRRNKRKPGRFLKNYSRKHTKTTPNNYESVQVSTEMFKQQNVEPPKNKENSKLDLTLEKGGLAAEVKKRETDFFSEPENITKRNLQDVYYKALEDAKKTTKIAIQKKVLDQYDKTVTDSVKT